MSESQMDANDIFAESFEPSYRSRLMKAYVQALEEMRGMVALDFIAVQCQKILQLEAQLWKAGHRPVCHGGFWEAKPLTEADRIKGFPRPPIP
jgi:hypothetical protein